MLRKILTNTSWLVAGQVVTRIFKFTLVVLAVKRLTFADYGVFAHILAYIAIFYAITSLFHTLSPLHNQLAKRREENHAILGEHVPWRLFLGGVVFIVMTVTGILGHIGNPALIIILGLSITLDFIRDVFGITLMSRDRMREEGIALSIQTGTTLLSTWLLFSVTQATPIVLALAFLFGSILGLIATLLFLRREVSFRDIAQKSKVPTIRFMKEYVPYGFGFGIASTLSLSLVFNSTLFLLGFYTDAATTGVASLLFQILQIIFIPYVMFGASNLSLLSREKEEGNLHQKIIAFMSLGLIAIPLVSVLVSLGAYFFVPIIFGPQTISFVNHNWPLLVVVTHFGGAVALSLYAYLALGRANILARRTLIVCLVAFAAMYGGLVFWGTQFVFALLALLYIILACSLPGTLIYTYIKKEKKAIAFPVSIFLISAALLLVIIAGHAILGISLIFLLYLISLPKLIAHLRIMRQTIAL